MDGIHSTGGAHVAPESRAKPTMQAIAGLSMLSAALCAGSFVLLLATAISDHLIRFPAFDTAEWAGFLGQFIVPAIPMVLMLVLLAMRSHAAAALIGFAGASLYLALWMVAAF